MTPEEAAKLGMDYYVWLRHFSHRWATARGTREKRHREAADYATEQMKKERDDGKA